MKTNILPLLAAGCLAIATASCDGNWTPPSEADGQLAIGALEVRNDDAVKLVKNDMSRAAADELKDYQVTISRKGESTPVKTYTYGSMPEVETLNVGDYTVEVKSHQVQKAEWDRPYFVGSKDFSVKSGQITDVDEIVCKFSSIKVTIDYTPALSQILSEATVNVKANDEGELDFALGEKRAGYFEAIDGSTTMIVTFNGKINGTAISSIVNLADVAAGQHRIITFDVKGIPGIPEQTGSIDPTTGITVDASVIIEDIDGNQTIDEDVITGQKRPWEPETPDTPVDPTPGEDTPITFTSDNLNLNGINHAANYTGDLGTATVLMKADAGFTNLFVTISTDNKMFESAVSEFLPLSFDLAYPGSNETTFVNFGFPVGDGVIGKTELVFDISQFVPLLGNFDGNHAFTIKAVDAQGNELEKTLQFTK